MNRNTKPVRLSEVHDPDNETFGIRTSIRCHVCGDNKKKRVVELHVDDGTIYVTFKCSACSGCQTLMIDDGVVAWVFPPRIIGRDVN